MILSIDPGTQKTGWAVFDNDNLLLSGTFYQKSDDVVLRSIAITNSLVSMAHLKEFNIKDVVIEDQYVRKNVKGTIVLSRLVGMIQYAFFNEFQCNVYTIAPTTVYSVLPFNAVKAKKNYHKMVVEYVSSLFNLELTSVDEAFAILLGLAFIKKRDELK